MSVGNVRPSCSKSTAAVSDPRGFRRSRRNSLLLGVPVNGSEAPQDRVLKLGPGQASPKLAAILAWLAVDLPFDQVPDVVAQTLGLVIDGEMVRRVTETMGSWAESQEQLAIQEAPSGQAVPSAPGPSTLFIALDGAMLHTKRS